MPGSNEGQPDGSTVLVCRAPHPQADLAPRFRGRIHGVRIQVVPFRARPTYRQIEDWSDAHPGCLVVRCPSCGAFTEYIQVSGATPPQGHNREAESETHRRHRGKVRSGWARARLDDFLLRSLPYLLLVLAAGLFSHGCSDAPVATRAMAADTLVVSYPRLEGDTATLDLIWNADLPSAGAANSRPSRVWGLAASPGGDLFVALWDGSVLRFARDGAPGGFIRVPDVQGVRVTNLAALPDGGIAIRDNASDHLLRVAPDGIMLDSVPLPEGLPAYGGDAVRLGTDGRLWLALTPDSAALADTLYFPRPVYAALDDEGRLRDTLWVGADAPCSNPSIDRYRFGWFEDFRVRYIPKMKWALHPDGTVVRGCPSTFEFQITGDTTPPLRVVADRAPVPVSEEERSAFMLTWQVQMNEAGKGGDEGWRWEGEAIPANKPTYHRILVADDGRVWVWPAGESLEVATPATWPLAQLPAAIFVEPSSGAFDVFSTDGTLLGHVFLPPEVGYTGFPDSPDPVIRGDTVWAVVSDSLGHRGVGRYQVRWGSS